jgi:hypothetical protein
MLVGGFDQFMQWWGLDYQMGFWTASQFIEKLFEIHAIWRPHVFKIERKFTSFLQYAIRLKERELGIVLPILWIDRDMRSKETRYVSLEPMFRAGRIRLAYEIEEKTKREIEDELTRCGSSAHDEFLDCLSDQFEQLNPVIGNEGMAATFNEETPELVAVTMPVSKMRYSMYGSPDAGLDD